MEVLLPNPSAGIHCAIGTSFGILFYFCKLGGWEERRAVEGQFLLAALGWLRGGAAGLLGFGS